MSGTRGTAQDSGENRHGSKDEENSRLDSALRAGFLVAVVAIAFVTGSLLTASDTFPGSEIARAYEGGKALYRKLSGYGDVYTSDLWFPERRPDQGVTAHLPSRAQPGVTLYTSGDGPAAALVSMDGNVLQEWRRPFSTVWNEHAAVKKPQPDSHVYFRKAMLYPNGDILALYEGVGDTPYGYGLVKLDRNSEVIWSYLEHTHHDMDIGADGRIYVLTHEVSDKKLESFDNLAAARLDDFLVVLSPDGKELKKVSLIDVVAKSRYKHLIHTVSWYSIADPLHANGIDLITEEMAANFPFGRPGQVLVSFRELGAIGVVDLETEELVWATRGPWIGQHDPDILPNGNILLFDNYAGYGGPENASRVIEFNPGTMEIVWQYGGNEDQPLGSFIRSEVQRLTNGNTLITESNGGRIVEISPEGDVVWEYINPKRGGSKRSGPRIAIVNWAQRIDPAGLDPSLLEPRAHSQLSESLSHDEANN